MTEKRFTYDEFEDCIIDNLTGKTHWGLDDILNNKLNELHEENQSTKHLLEVHIAFCKSKGYELKDILDFIGDVE